MHVTSSAFEDMGSIPVKYTCDAENPVSPPLSISDVPENAKSLALIVEDPDVPKQFKPDGIFDHLILFNLPPDTKEIGEGQSGGGMFGLNGRNAATYGPPCPPKEFEPSRHRYIFTLYALDIEQVLGNATTTTKQELHKAMEGHILGQSTLTGTYQKQ